MAHSTRIMNEGVTPPIVILCLFVVVSCGSWIRMVESTCLIILCALEFACQSKNAFSTVLEGLYSYLKDD